MVSGTTVNSDAIIYGWSKHLYICDNGVQVAVVHDRTNWNYYVVTSTDGFSSSNNDIISGDSSQTLDNNELNPSMYGVGNTIHIASTNNSVVQYNRYSVASDGTLTHEISQETVSGGLVESSAGHVDICVTQPNGVIYITHHVSLATSSNWGFHLRYRDGGNWTSAGEYTDSLNNDYEGPSLRPMADGTNDCRIYYIDQSNGYVDETIYDYSADSYTTTTAVSTAASSSKAVHSYDSAGTAIHADSLENEWYFSDGTSSPLVASGTVSYILSGTVVAGRSATVFTDGTDTYMNVAPGDATTYDSADEEVVQSGGNTQPYPAYQTHSMNRTSTNTIDYLYSVDKGEVGYDTYAVSGLYTQALASKTNAINSTTTPTSYHRLHQETVDADNTTKPLSSFVQTFDTIAGSLSAITTSKIADAEAYTKTLATKAGPVSDIAALVEYTRTPLSTVDTQNATATTFTGTRSPSSVIDQENSVQPKSNFLEELASLCASLANGAPILSAVRSFSPTIDASNASNTLKTALSQLSALLGARAERATIGTFERALSGIAGMFTTARKKFIAKPAALLGALAVFGRVLELYRTLRELLGVGNVIDATTAIQFAGEAIMGTISVMEREWAAIRSPTTTAGVLSAKTANKIQLLVAELDELLQIQKGGR